MAQKSSKTRRSTNPITGVVNVTGEGDSGKTTFGMNSGAAIERTAFIDNDVKGKNIKRQADLAGRVFAYYQNLTQVSAKGGMGGKPMKEIEFHEYCMNVLEELSSLEGQLDVILWDTWTPFENTFQPYVHSRPNEFKQFYSAMGQIKGAEEWNASFEYEARVLDAMSEIAPLVILTSHLKNDAQKRQVAEAKKPLIQKAFMRIYLRHGVNTPKPTALFLKRPLKMEFGSSMDPINVIQRKVPEFTWQKLLWYWENPVGDTPPTAEEQLTELELSILDGILTRDQKDVLKLAVLEAEKEKIAEERQQKLLRQISQAPVPEVPEDVFGLMSKAMEVYDIDSEKLAEILGVAEEDLMEVDDAAEAWKTVKKYVNEKATAKSSNGKRRK
jgi:hypothetical protein